MSELEKLLDYWQPPDEVGAPLRLLATTFTYEPEFFQAQCLGRFLKLEGQYGEVDDLSFVIEQEERLSEVPTTVVVDRSYGAEPRSLRWDVLPVGLRGGVQHAKVSLLVWERLVRFIVSSANLVEGSYRNNVETAVVLDAHEEGDLPGFLFADLIEAVRAIVERGVGHSSRPGPKRRALSTLRFVETRLAEFQLGEHLPQGAPRIAIASSGPGRPVFAALRSIWRGSRPRRAIALSPFFDTGEKDCSAADALAGELARQGTCDLTFVMPVDQLDARTLVQAPQALYSTLPDRMVVSLCAFDPREEDRGRRLHAKAVLLESDDWIAALVGSSNFTTAGLGIHNARANLELNVAIGAPKHERKLVRGLREIAPHGPSLSLDAVDWCPQEDEEQAKGAELPWGFQDFLLEPGTPPKLTIGLWPKELPAKWEVSHPGQGKFADQKSWASAGRPSDISVELVPNATPFFVNVEWESDGGNRERASWPVNVSNPDLLPPPAELRDLPTSVLIAALSSTRPLHESLTAAISRHKRARATGSDVDLDPLTRFSATGRFLQRAREVAAALEGLAARLERPAGSEEALAWRLGGPVGPVALANSLVGDAQAGATMAGEVSFLLGEIALTLGRADWSQTDKLLGEDRRRLHVAAVLRQLKALRRQLEQDDNQGDPRLAAYVNRAFRKARA